MIKIIKGNRLKQIVQQRIGDIRPEQLDFLLDCLTEEFHGIKQGRYFVNEEGNSNRIKTPEKYAAAVLSNNGYVVTRIEKELPLENDEKVPKKDIKYGKFDSHIYRDFVAGRLIPNEVKGLVDTVLELAEVYEVAVTKRDAWKFVLDLEQEYVTARSLGNVFAKGEKIWHVGCTDDYPVAVLQGMGEVGVCPDLKTRVDEFCRFQKGGNPKEFYDTCNIFQSPLYVEMFEK